MGIGSVSNPVGSPYFYLHLPFQWPLSRPLPQSIGACIGAFVLSAALWEQSVVVVMEKVGVTA